MFAVSAFWRGLQAGRPNCVVVSNMASSAQRILDQACLHDPKDNGISIKFKSTIVQDTRKKSPRITSEKRIKR
jgi:hypothetical protein